MALTQVKSDGIATGAVTATQIAVNAVTVDDISDGSISTAKLAPDCVDGTKIADDAVNTEHIADDAVGADQLANTAVTAGSYGDASNIPSITVDAQGRVTAASTNAINVESDRIFEGDTAVECVDTVADGHITFDTQNNEAARFDSSGRLLIGTTTQSNSSLLTVEGNTSNNAGAGEISLKRGEPAANISSGESLGHIYFTDNNDNPFAEISAWAHANAGTNDFPGRLLFLTTTDGRNGVSERMRVSYNGVFASDGLGLDSQVLINDTTPSFNENFKVQSYASSAAGTNYGSVFNLTNNGYKPSNTSYNLYVNTDCFGARTGIYSQTNSGWNDTNIAIHGKSGGGQYSQGIGVLAEIQHSDANGPGWQPALYAKGVSATNSTSGGAGCAVFHLVNSQPAANPMNKCIDEYNGSNTRQWFTFTRNGSQIGSISHTSSSTSYNTSSDYRLKENVVTLTGEDAESRLRQLPVKRFNFISEPGKTVDGFLAHEVSPYVPEAVTGEKDGMKTEPVYDETGKMILENDEPVMQTVPEYQEIDQAKLVPLLTAALQKAFDKIDALEARLAALEA